MKQLYRIAIFILHFGLLFLIYGSIPIVAAPLFIINDSMIIYYEEDADDDNCTGQTTLGEFVKFTLPFEWPSELTVMERPEGIESFRAGAIAVRTNAVSVYHTREVVKNNVMYLCAIHGRQNHKPNDPKIGDFPNAQQAVIDTAGIILTHPDATAREQQLGRTIQTGAIDAQYRDETGFRTNQGYFDNDPNTNDPVPWLTPIYDPISPSFSQTGMGQNGTKRWAWGEDDQGVKYPQWDYRRILAHYYSDVSFVGIIPTPPNAFRTNVSEVQGIPPNGGLVLCKGEERSGIVLRSKNSGSPYRLLFSLLTTQWAVNPRILRFVINFKVHPQKVSICRDFYTPPNTLNFAKKKNG